MIGIGTSYKKQFFSSNVRKIKFHYCCQIFCLFNILLFFINSPMKDNFVRRNCDLARGHLSPAPNLK